jgi:hypothetical protein
MPRELCRPPIDVVMAVIGRVITPILRDIEKDLGSPLPIVVTLWTPNMEGPKVMVTGKGTLEAGIAEKPRGEMRLSFRETALEGRLLFFGETVVEEDVSPTTGFSGFDIRGEVQIKGSEIAVEGDSRTIKYKVWRFRGWR